MRNIANRYDEICRMVGDVSIRWQSFSDEILLYAKRHGYDTTLKQKDEYARIFNKDNETILEITNKRNAFLHETAPVVFGGFMEEYLSRDYSESKRLYDEFVEYFDAKCSPLLAVIDEGWYKKTQEEITALEELKDKFRAELIEIGHDL